jgi:hypothetical protein
MLIKDTANTTTGTILTPSGEIAQKPTMLLSDDDARLLREYKKFLQRHGLRETLYCNTCFEGNLNDGLRAFVTDGQILFECRHRMLFHQGQSF